MNLTSLGYDQVYASGQYFKSRYLSDTSSKKIYGINQDLVKLSQLSVEAPVDNVLQNSATGWLQGLYPPVSTVQTLADGTNSTSPLNGYQLIPVNAVASASTTSSSSTENSAWLQGSSGCTNAVTSSNNYFISTDYLNTLSSTRDFYTSLLPSINSTFTSATNTYKNAYTIYDYVHVSEIHNASWPSKSLLTDSVLLQLQSLANQHEFNLAYNVSDPIRAIAGSTLAAQIVQNLNATLTSRSSLKLNVQFGAYASFLSFFGLAQLPAANVNFTGIVDYASAMVFELVTNATVSSSSYPATADIGVRFFFSNGSAAASGNGLSAYPLFGQSSAVISWSDFTTQMGKIAIGDQATWCSKCGVSDGSCASYTTISSSSSGSAGAVSNTGGSGISTVVAGVIGAMVTLAVVLGLEAILLFFGGFGIIKKQRAGKGIVAENVPIAQKA